MYLEAVFTQTEIARQWPQDAKPGPRPAPPPPPPMSVLLQCALIAFRLTAAAFGSEVIDSQGHVVVGVIPG